MNKRYTLPPEWAQQSGVMLTWPHDKTDWAPILPQVEAELLSLAKVITQHEGLIISCYSKEHRDYLIQRFQDNDINLEECRFLCVQSNDSWARDHGPITVCRSDFQTDKTSDSQTPLLLDFKFNGWGDKYSWELDNQITKKLHQHNAFNLSPIESVDFILEGGSIEVDGNGSLLTTTSCLLNKNRNDCSVAETESYLKEKLGVKQIFWLHHGHLMGDDTDGHIDMLARFINPNTILYVHCDNPNDPHYDELKKMEAELKTFRNTDNQAYHLIPLPWPSARYSSIDLEESDPERLPLTYANFLIINEGVLIPNYGIQEDERANALFERLFPERKIYPLSSQALIEQRGSIHCVTMQLPNGVLS